MRLSKSDLQVSRIIDEGGRRKALEVMRSTYRDEKHWISSDDKLVSLEELQDDSVAWFVAEQEGAPVGVLRVLYAPPLDLYAAYGFKLVAKNIDLDAFIRDNRIAEIGRITAPAKRTIDADGLTVAPGWVDIHTHYDGQVCWDAELAPSSWQGVTTILMGNCGVG